MVKEKVKILFVCKDNAVCSQIAEGFINTFFCSRYKAYSAGVEPSEININTSNVMAEIGVDISKCCSKSIEEFSDIKFDCIITLCDYAKTFSSLFPESKKYIHKGFKNPAEPKSASEENLLAFRNIRENIFSWIEKEIII